MAKVTQENNKSLSQSLYYIDPEEQVYYILARHMQGTKFVSLATGESYNADGSLGRSLRQLPAGTILKVVL